MYTILDDDKSEKKSQAGERSREQLSEGGAFLSLKGPEKASQSYGEI